MGGHFDKQILQVCDDLDLPKFQRAKREHHQTKLHGREVLRNHKRALTLSSSLSRDKPQRKLLIVETKQPPEAACRLSVAPESQKTPMATSVQMARII